MKFVSKSSNLFIVLRPGLPAQPITGTPAVPGVSVRFRDGMASVEDEDLIKMMLKHPGFNSDYIAVEEDARDPYASGRQDAEPGHVVTEMMFGMPVARKVTKGKTTFSPEVEKAIQEAGKQYAKAMLPELLAAAVEEMKKQQAPAVKSTEADAYPVNTPEPKEDAPKATKATSKV